MRAPQRRAATNIRVVGLLLNTLWAWSGLAAVAGWFVSGPEVHRRHAMLPPLAGAAVLLAATVSYYIVDTGSVGAAMSEDRADLTLFAGLSRVAGTVLGSLDGLARRSSLTGALAALAFTIIGVFEMSVLRGAVLIDDPARQRSLLVRWVMPVSATAVVIARLRRSPTS